VTGAIEVPGDGPLFAGHFPGRPILPGIAELAMVASLLAPPDGPATLLAIPFLRFRALVMPGDRLDVSASPAADGAVRFQCRRGGGLVANGAILYGVPGGVGDRGTPVAARPPRGIPPLDDLIPHRPPMRFVERLVGEAEDGITSLARVPATCALVSRGIAGAFVALEAAAQTAAVWEAVHRSRRGDGTAPRIGYLVSARDVTMGRATIPAGADLVTSIRFEAAAGPLSHYAVEVVVEGAVALRGSIGTYLND
jgi:3-hydroxyacyl-[acyl-carrier-protein] dehydratase